MTSKSIVGIGQPTVELGKLLPNGTLSIDRDARHAESDGDGTVPRFSAEAPAPSGFDGHWLYVPQTHGMLPCDAVVHAHLGDILAPRAPGAPPPATPLPRFTLRRAPGEHFRIEADSLALTVAKPFYKSGQPVELGVVAHSATGYPFDSKSVKVTVRVEQIASVGKRVRPIRVRVSPDRKRPGWFTGALRAPAPGTYRVTAATSHRLLAPFRVAELFEVDAGK
jgi:hypothetical protein